MELFAETVHLMKKVTVTLLWLVNDGKVIFPFCIAGKNAGMQS